MNKLIFTALALVFAPYVNSQNTIPSVTPLMLELYGSPPYSFTLKEREPIELMTQVPLRSAHSYALSDDSELAKARAKSLGISPSDNYVVKTQRDLHKALKQVTQREQGLLYINAFHIKGDIRDLYFKDIERLVVNGQHYHVEVGLCLPKFHSALALGPNKRELYSGLSPKPSLCANAGRLKYLGKIELLHSLEVDHVVVSDR